ncbi:MAG: periplasmic heavy metal sensor [Thermoanaerobaculia bacterium]
MKQWWLVMALLLSVGINIGILAGRAWPGREAPEGGGGAAVAADRWGREPPPEAPAAGREAPRRQPRVVERMATELRLSGDERERFIERQVSFFEQTIAARIRFGRLQNELSGELVVGDPDRQRIDALLADIAAAHVDLERAFVDNLLDTREILDPEQQRRFLHFLQRLRRSGDDVRRRLQEQFQRLGPGPGRDRPGRDRPGGPPRRQRRPPDQPPADPPPPPNGS